MAIRGIVIWLLWMERNDAVFNDLRWTKDKLFHKIWLRLIDYGRLN
jgi:hypothetical protein